MCRANLFVGQGFNLAKVIVGIGLLIMVNTAWAVPDKINLQGKLTDAEGSSINGTRSIVFKIYDEATDGTVKWTETQDSVSVTNGILHVLLGSITSLTTAVFDGGDRWLGIKVGTDQEMTPRQQLVSSGYALRAQVADNNVLKTGDTMTGDLEVNGNVKATSFIGNGSQLIGVGGVPSGVIVMWSGTIASIPDGWALCDGTGGSPDLRDKFIYGTGVNPGGTGGAITHSHTVDSHTHSVDPPNTTSSDANTGFYGTPGETKIAAKPHTHDVDIAPVTSTAVSPGTSAVEHLPPYYKLAFIIKL